MEQNPKIVVTEQTKKVLDNLKKSGQTYNQIIEQNLGRNIKEPDLTNEKMPIFRHIETDKELMDCWIIADTGSWLWLFSKKTNIGTESKSIIQINIDKLILRKIQKIEPTFQLTNKEILDIRQACNQFPLQWIENKIPKLIHSTPEEITKFLKKINGASK